jgi:hypothetical protein
VDTSEDSLKWRLHAIAYFLFPAHVDKGMIWTSQTPDGRKIVLPGNHPLAYNYGVFSCFLNISNFWRSCWVWGVSRFHATCDSSPAQAWPPLRSELRCTWGPTLDHKRKWPYKILAKSREDVKKYQENLNSTSESLLIS